TRLSRPADSVSLEPDESRTGGCVRLARLLRAAQPEKKYAYEIHSAQTRDCLERRYARHFSSLVRITGGPGLCFRSLGWRAPRGVASFQLAGGRIELRGNIAQKLRGPLFRFRRDFLLEVTAQSRELLFNALPKFFKLVHLCVHRNTYGDLGIIGTLCECRKEDRWRFPINGNGASRDGKTRRAAFLAAVGSRRAPNCVRRAARLWASTPHDATSAALISIFRSLRRAAAFPE